MNWTYVITIASIIGTIANIYRKRWCFVVWICTNTTWFIYDCCIGEYSQAILWGVYAVLAGWGLSRWRTEQS